MSERPLLSATLIARNEKHNVKRLLDSLWAHVDEVCVADTGSTDGTIAEFRRYAQRHKQPDKLKIVRVKWTDDFAAARQAADELATGEWLIWADMDDTVQGMHKLREFAAAATAEIVAFFCHYQYARDADGNTISELWRERMVRNDGTQWQGRLHEHKTFNNGAIVRVNPEDADWIHHRDHTQRTGDRNLRILEQWDKDDPDNPRVLQSMAMEYMGLDRHQDASETFARYLALKADTPDRRAQATRHMCVMLMIQGRVEEARAAALAALDEMWMWPDTHLTLAEIAHTSGRPEQGIVHAQTALQIGKPDTLLIINPLQYTAHPRALIAACLAMMGRFEEAVQTAEEALQIAPSYQLVTQHLPMWRAQLRKQHAVGAFTMCADTLIETGELLKAQAVLAAAPFYVAEQPALIQRRAQVHRLIRERALTATMREDPAADAFIERHQQEAAAA